MVKKNTESVQMQYTHPSMPFLPKSFETDIEKEEKEKPKFSPERLESLSGFAFFPITPPSRGLHRFKEQIAG